ncbi:MAG: Gfo/Idh/MocA family oxidoreductase [Ferruginibacter sp.]
MKEHLKIGIIGAGGFANFAAKSFLKINGISIVGVYDIDIVAAKNMANELQTKIYDNIKDLLNDSIIDLVYIATPPFLHFTQSKAALYAGKHVVCEKPAALKTKEAEELTAYAKQHNLLYVVNLMQRYNPLYKIVNSIIQENILGDFIHGFFENYASDEALTENHWFWDDTKSGGIFIEHGVHFFDMFAGWLGEGKLVNAVKSSRPGVAKKITDRVQATVSYKDSFVNFYHGFNQPKILDRQEMRLQFEKGDITLYEWIPVQIKINAILKNKTIERLSNLLPNCTVEQHKNNFKKTVRGNFKAIDYDEYVTINYGDMAYKMKCYEELVIAMLTDQWAWIKDKAHKRIIDETNAIESLKIAELANNAAVKIS